MPTILSGLKPGAYFVTTVREKMFSDRAPWERAIAAASCILVEAELMEYYGEIKANVLVIQKP